MINVTMTTIVRPRHGFLCLTRSVVRMTVINVIKMPLTARLPVSAAGTLISPMTRNTFVPVQGPMSKTKTTAPNRVASSGNGSRGPEVILSLFV